MSRPRAILFDIGSTLWSSPPEDPGALDYCYGRGRVVVLEALGWAPPQEQLVQAVEGYFAEWEDIWRVDAARVQQEPTPVFVADALRKLDVVLPEPALRAFTDAILETSVYTAKVQPHEPGMEESLAELRALGLSLACVSNAFMGAGVLHQIMTERGLGQHLDWTVSSCELGIRKPHPQIYQEALQRYGLAGEAAIFVGDRLDADVEGPAALGMRTVLTHQYRQEDPSRAKVAPHHVIRHLSELVDYVRALG